MWRCVSRKWKKIIDDCPSLWSTIVVTNRNKHVKFQLENSKAAPLNIQILTNYASSNRDESWIQLLVDNAYRWKSLRLVAYPENIVQRLVSSPSMLDSLEIQFISIPDDCRLFSLIRPNLRKLVLLDATFPHDFDPELGLEELFLHSAHESRATRGRIKLSVSKFHQFIQANPKLRILHLHGHLTASPNDNDLQSVNLPKLEDVTISNSQVLHLFRSDYCAKVRFEVYSVIERPQPLAWTTPVHTLRRVGRFKITVGNKYLRVTAMTGPYKVQVSLDTGVPSYGLVYSMLEDFLNEAEKDTHISARVELELFADKPTDNDFDPRLDVLKLFQTPVWDPSSDQNRWRIPNLDTISMLDPGLPYHRLQAFIQARSNGNYIRPASPITGVFTQSTPSTRKHRKEVLDKVMTCSVEGNDS
ncbi:hypothetical protein FS837_004602 [Tulasnella sp. UAMH 9824]|nr:hypothetical protein FS837_004602 [Tulasnella sp. UAMH 9824]